MMHPADLETLADTALKSLPPPRAPHTLLPRVMAVVQEWSLRPWYTRGWFAWPRGWQAAAVVTLMLLTTGGIMLLPSVYEAAGPTVSRLLAGPAGTLATVSSYVNVASDVGGILWRALLEPVARYAVGVVLLMCVACALFGAALNHVFLGRMQEQ